MVKKLASLFKSPTWNFLGFFVGTVLGVAGLYAGFHEKRPSVRFEITNEANMLDIRQSLPDLQISFQGEDVQQKGLNLRIITLRVLNDGEIDILQSLYDQAQPWGFRLTAGRIIEARPVMSLSPYLASAIKPRLTSDNTVEFEKAIFERGQSFVMDLVVLHEKSVEPDVQVVGKIAGVDGIVPVRTSLLANRPSLSQQLFGGGLLVILLRIVVYGVGLIVSLIGIFTGVVLTDRAIDWLKIRRRRRKLRDFLKAFPNLDTAQFNPALTIYVEYGPKGLSQMLEVLADPTKRQGLLDYEEKNRKRKADRTSKTIAADSTESERHEQVWRMRMNLMDNYVDALISDAVIREDDATVSIDPEVETAVGQLSKFLRN